MNSYEVNLEVSIETKILVGAETPKAARAHAIRILADDSLLGTGDDRVVEELIHKQCNMIDVDDNSELMAGAREGGQVPFGYYKQAFTINKDLGDDAVRLSHYPSTKCVTYAVPAREYLEEALETLQKLCDDSGGFSEVGDAISNLKNFLEETVGSRD
jgi:hypothetical protein